MEGALFVDGYESLVAIGGPRPGRGELCVTGNCPSIYHILIFIYERAFLVEGGQAGGGKSAKFRVWGQRSFKPLGSRGFQGEKNGFGVRGQNWT